jgi:hypothetical protein
VPEPGSPFGDPQIEAELEANRARLALLGTETQADRQALNAIGDTLGRLAADNEEVVRLMRNARGSDDDSA